MAHRKTVKRYNDPGHAHALTFSCFQRRAFLSKDRSCQWLVDAVDRARDKYRFHIWAYVIMPEHAHFLIWPTIEDYDVSVILKAIKKSLTNRALTFLRNNNPGSLAKMEDRQPNGDVHYRFWQRGGGYDVNVVEPAATHRQIVYIHNNPVRRGLCLRPEDWKWSSAADYAGLLSGPLRVDMESVPTLVC